MLIRIFATISYEKRQESQEKLRLVFIGQVSDFEDGNWLQEQSS